MADWGEALDQPTGPPSFVDFEELPFTADEIYRAARLFLSDADAHQMADHLAACGPTYIANREKRRAEWRRAGVPEVERLPLDGWAYPEWLLPALAVLSANCATRVHGLIQRHWAEVREGRRYAAQVKAAEEAGLLPTRGKTVKDPRRQPKAPSEGTPKRGVVSRSAVPLPPLTPEMIHAVERQIDGEVRAWEALLDEAHKRLQATQNANPGNGT